MSLPPDLSTWFAARTGQAVQLTTDGAPQPVIPVQVYDDAVAVTGYDPASGALSEGGVSRLVELSAVTAVSQPRPAPAPNGQVVTS